MSRNEVSSFLRFDFPGIAVKPPLVIDQGNPIKVEEVRFLGDR